MSRFIVAALAAVLFAGSASAQCGPAGCPVPGVTRAALPFQLVAAPRAADRAAVLPRVRAVAAERPRILARLFRGRCR